MYISDETSSVDPHALLTCSGHQQWIGSPMYCLALISTANITKRDGVYRLRMISLASMSNKSQINAKTRKTILVYDRLILMKKNPKNNTNNNNENNNKQDHYSGTVSPASARSLKLSNHGPGWYLDGEPSTGRLQSREKQECPKSQTGVPVAP